MRNSKVLLAICASMLMLMLSYSAAYSETAQRGTPTPTATGTATQLANTALFGPRTGDLTLPLDFVETGLKLRDFKLKMRFYNPYALEDGNWLLAILFRTRGRTAAAGYALGISANGEWALSNLGPNNQQITLDSGQLPQMKLAKGEYNDIELTIEDDTGLLMVNDEEAASLLLYDLRNDTTNKDLLVGAFGSLRNMIAHYEDLTITGVDDDATVELTRTPSVSIPCVVTTTHATPLLEQPDRDAPRIASLPNKTKLEGSGLSSDLLWIKVSYGGQVGWVISFSAQLGNGCADLPIERP